MINTYKQYVSALLPRHKMVLLIGYFAIALALIGSFFTLKPVQLSLGLLGTLCFGFIVGSIVASIILLFYRINKIPNYLYSLPLRRLLPELAVRIFVWVIAITSIPLWIAIAWCIAFLPILGLLYMVQLTKIGYSIMMGIAGTIFISACFFISEYFKGSKDNFKIILKNSLINCAVFFLIYSLMQFGNINNMAYH